MLRIRRMRGPAYDPALTTLGASMCGALAVIFAAGNTADYLLAEVQFWLFAALVSMLWLSERDTPAQYASSEVVGLRRLAA